MVPY
jgi:hypothetical protein